MGHKERHLLSGAVLLEEFFSVKAGSRARSSQGTKSSRSRSIRL